MKILYIANVRLPTEKAHGIQIMKTCEAFASLGHSVELVIPTRHNALTDSPFDYYNVKHVFKITTLRVPDFVRFGRLGFLFSALWFSERARWLKQFWSADIIYSCDHRKIEKELGFFTFSELVGSWLLLWTHKECTGLPRTR